MILKIARSKVSHLIGEAITHVGFGVGVNAVTPDDLALTTPYIKPVSGVSYPAVDLITIDWTLSKAEANGMVITEIAFYFADGTIYERKRIGAMEKTADLSLSGSQTLKVRI